MTVLMSLWLPILLAAVVVFAASSIMHMLLPYHKGDYKKLPEEEKALAVLRSGGLAPGQYIFPYSTEKERNSPEAKEKFKQGPVGMMFVRASGEIQMGKFLGMWFGFLLIVGIFVAYLTGHTVEPGANYLQVFRVAGTAAFLAYGLGNLSNGIWKGQPWSVTIKEVLDGLVYGLLTAGVFGWLWPR